MRIPKKPDERRKNNTTPLKEVIEQMYETYKLNGKRDEARLLDLWPKVMGPSIAKRTEQVFFRENKLYVRINSAPLKHQLSISRSKIIGLLNAEMGKMMVKEVILL